MHKQRIIFIKCIYFIPYLVAILTIAAMFLYHYTSSAAAQNTFKRIETKLQTNPDNSLQANHSLLRAKIALEEYRRGVKEKRKDCNCGARIDIYNDGRPQQWCATFASWVAKESGKGFENEGHWQLKTSRQIKDYLQKYGTFYAKDKIVSENLRPKPGDFVIYYRGSQNDNLGHVDIVVGNITDRSADLVGGNIRGTIAYRSSYPYLEYDGFIGFGRIEH